MNYKAIINVIGKILLVEAILLLFPLGISFLYGENTWHSFVVPIAILFALGLPQLFYKPKDTRIYAKEGFIIVGIAWIVMSAFGALPFVLSKEIPSYIDAFFETVSGFTTTGATILTDIEALSNGMLFWRSFTHWIGGMGVLVFLLAIVPGSDNGLMHVFRAESPGPSVGKIVSKMKYTARILYGIYIGLTVVEVIFLVAGKMPVFDSFVNAFATAGTGGFAIKNASIGGYNNVYYEMVIAVFMFLFGINFNIFYFIIIRNFGRAFKNEELIVYVGIVVVSTLAIAVNILSLCNNFGEAIRYSFFQVTSYISSTGFSTADVNTWPTLSKAILVFLMLIGAMAGSTGGGFKVSRMCILIKSGLTDIKKLIHPRAVVKARFERSPIPDEVKSSTRTYLTLFMSIWVICTLIVSIEGKHELITNITASLSCLNNIGPALGINDFSSYSWWSKLLFSLEMLTGRLEIFPIIILFHPSTWSDFRIKRIKSGIKQKRENAKNQSSRVVMPKNS